MSTNIFVNLAVKDLQRSTAFYEALGYTRNEQFSDQNAACIVISDQIYVMLLVEEFFSTFTDKEIVDANAANRGNPGVVSRQQGRSRRTARKGSGGRRQADQGDRGSGLHVLQQLPGSRGHQWEIVWMDPGAVATQ